MRAILTVVSGIDADRRLWLDSGNVATVGQSEFADLSIHGDEDLSPEHFVLECGPGSCLIRNLNVVAGTTVNGRLIITRNLKNGDRIVAGRTEFAVTIEPPESSNPPATVPVADLKSRVFDILSRIEAPLFALVDAARHPMVLPLLLKSKCHFQNLYEGPQGEALAVVAPYIVQIDPNAGLLRELVEQGWGDSWGIYCTSGAPLLEIRKNFRRFLMVQAENGESVYFRFYDPRVLRLFLPTCLPDEADRFFGPVAEIFVEDVRGTSLLQFSATDRGQPAAIGLTNSPMNHPAELHS